MFKKKEVKKTMQLYSMMALPLLQLIIFAYVPMVGIILAFKKYRYDLGIFGSEWIGLENFKFFLKSNDFLNVTWNTLSLNFLFIIVGTVGAIMLAFCFYKLTSKKLVKIYQTISITPHFLSWVVVGYMTYALLHPEYGFINKLIVMFGGEAVNWYSEPKAWPAILTITNLWKHVGMDCVIYYAALIGIDSTLIEAAQIDGANERVINFKIILPELMSLVSIMTILNIGKIFRADFGLFYQITRDIGQLYEVTDVLDTYLYRTMKITGDMGLSTAVGLLQSVVGLVLVVTTNKIVSKINPDNALF